jgi:general secretion pathway protein A
MDRPAILTLIDSDGNSHDVVLTGITGDSAELSLGGVRVTQSVADISDAWFGQFMLLWRPPTGAAVSLGRGSRGSDVIWLRNSLAAIDGRYASADVQSDVFDAELEQLVRSFQRDHRLDVDGLAGQQTQIIINSLLAVEGTPRLSTPRLAQD